MFDKLKKSRKFHLSNNSEGEKKDNDPLRGTWTIPILTLNESDCSEDEDMDNDPMFDPFFEYQFRVILIGDSGAGKSSLLR